MFFKDFSQKFSGYDGTVNITIANKYNEFIHKVILQQKNEDGNCVEFPPSY